MLFFQKDNRLALIRSVRVGIGIGIGIGVCTGVCTGVGIGARVDSGISRARLCLKGSSRRRSGIEGSSRVDWNDSTSRSSNPGT